MRAVMSIVCLLGLAAPTFAQGKVEFPTPKGWEQVPSTSKLRFAQFRPRNKPGPMLVIFRFDGHGKVETVTNRWLSRIEQPDGSSTRAAATLTRWTRGSLTLHLIDAQGTRVPSKGHARKGAPTQPRPGWRLLAGVLVGPGGPYFIRLEGKAAQLRDLADGFFELAFGARPKAAGQAPAPITAKGLVFRPGPAWKIVKTTSRMRAAEFRLPLPGGSSLQLIVYHFGQGRGGNTQANLKRWISQFRLPDGSPADSAATITKKTLPNGVRLTVLDVKGTFVAPTAPGSSTAVNRPGQRMLAAIVECPTGPFFVKVVGAEKAVSSQEGSIRRFLDRLRPAR